MPFSHHASDGVVDQDLSPLVDGGTDVAQDGQEGDDAIVLPAVLIGVGRGGAELAGLEAALHEGGDGAEGCGRVAVAAEEEVGHPGVVGHGDPGGEDGLDDLLGRPDLDVASAVAAAVAAVAADCDRRRGGIKDGRQGEEGGGVVPQEALEAGQGDGGKEAEGAVGRPAAGGGGGDAAGRPGAGPHQAVEVAQHLLDGPGLAVLRQHGEVLEDGRAGTLVVVVVGV